MKKLKRYAAGCVTVLAALVTVGTLAYAVATWYYGHALESELARSRKMGWPVSLADVNAGADDPGNAAPIYRRALELLRQPEYRRCKETLAQASSAVALDPATRQELERCLVTVRAEIIPLLKQAAACDSCVFDIQPDVYKKENESTRRLMDDYSGMREVARLLYAEVMTRIAEGDTHAAASSALLALEVSRDSSSLPFIIGNLVSQAVTNISLRAVDAVASGRPDASDTAMLSAGLAALHPVAGMKQSLESEAFLSTALTQNIDSAPRLITRWWQVALIRHYRKLVGALTDSYTEFERNKPGDPAEERWLLAPPVPNFSQAMIKTYETQARVEAARLWLRIQSESNGIRATSDPFSDKPLIIQRQEGKLTVYSVGPNGRDDKGLGDDVAFPLPKKAADAS